MDENEITAVRRIRREISAECEDDVHAVLGYDRSVQEELKRSGEFRFEEPSKLPVPKTSEPASTQMVAT